MFNLRCLAVCRNLWFFVSKFTEYDHKKLYKVYKHAKQVQAKDTDMKPPNDERNDRKHDFRIQSSSKRKHDHTDKSEYSSSKRHDSKSSHHDRERRRSRERDEKRTEKDRSDGYGSYILLTF